MATVQEMLAGIEAQQKSTQQSVLSINEMLQELEGVKQPKEPETQSIMDWFKGGKREESIPLIERAGLQLPDAKNLQMVSLLATTASDERLASGIKKIIPEAQFEQDQYGNLVVFAPITGDSRERNQWTRFYPNPKGLNTVDIMQAAGAVSLGEAIALSGGLLGLPTSGILGGGLIGLSEAAIVEAASSALSDDPFQVFDLPLGFLGGAAGAKAADVLGGLISNLKTRPSSVLDKNGNLKTSVRNQLTELGLDPDNITAELAAKIKQQIRTVNRPEATARLAEAESLPTPIPLTRGEASGSRAQQLFEDQIESGVYGEGARLSMEARRGQQQEAIAENLSQIQRAMGGQEVLQAGQGGRAAQEALSLQRAAEKQAATQLFRQAEQAGFAFVTPNLAGAVADDLRGVLRTYNPSEIQATSSVVDEMEEILAAGGDIKRLFQLRQRLVNTGALNTPERAAAGAVRKQLDTSLEALVDQQLLSGAPEAVTAQIAAIRNYADFASRWKSDGVLKKLTEVVTRDGERTFKQDPASVANYLFGAKGSKLVSGTQMARDLNTLKRTLPEDQWNQLRQEAFLLMANRAQNVDRSGDIIVSGAKFQNFWNDMRNNNPDLVKGLFSAEEIRTISRFASVASRVTSGAKNYSNTATTANGLLQQLAGMLGNTSIARLAIRAPIIRGITNAVAGVRAEEAFKVPLGRATQPLSGAAGAALAGETGGDPIYDLYEGITGVQIPR